MSILLNIVLAVIALVFFFKFIRLKKLSESEFDNYEERLEEEISKRKEVELKYQSEAHYLNSASAKSNGKNLPKDGNQLISSMQMEIENLHKEKEEELKLRLEAEKQLELASQRISDAENKVEDWGMIHSENLETVANTIAGATEDLYQRLFSVLEEKFKNIPISAPVALANNNIKLEEIFKSAGLQPNTSYFMNNMIPVQTRKSVPCEAFVIFGKENCAIIDNKAAKFLMEFQMEKSKDEQKALEVLKSKMDRYLAYLSNPKYRSNVVNYFAMSGKIPAKANSTLIMLLNSENDVEEFRKSDENYAQILQKNQIYLHNPDSLRDFISA